MSTETPQAKLAQIEKSIASLEGLPPSPTIEATLQELRQEQVVLRTHLNAGDQSVVGSVAGENIITGEGNTVVYAEQGATVVIGEAPVKMPAIDRESALGRYLQHLISRNRYLQLQGIRSGGKLVHIELDQIYITLRATRQREGSEEEAFLATEADLAPGERQRPARHSLTTTETVSISVNQALAEFERLVVLGDPGSGKTTLLRYLALRYARDLAEQDQVVETKLGLSDESGHLPILLYLRQIGSFIKEHRPNEDGTEGHALLLDFLHQSLQGRKLNCRPTSSTNG